MSKKTVAWLVREDCEGHGVITFHHHGMAARREGAGELGYEFDDVEVSRAPEFDQYAEQGKVPPMALLENGWWMECHNCGHQVMADGRDEEDDTPLEDVVTVGQSIFCNQKCHDSLELKKKTQNEKFASFQQQVKAARPDLNFTQFTGEWPSITMVGKFTFPDSKYGGSVRDQNGDGTLTWYIANGDQQAWDTYEKQRVEA